MPSTILRSREASTVPERLAALEQRLNDHESRCEERLAEIKSSVGSTLQAVEGLKSRFWGITLALLAWALAQLWATNQARFAHLEARAPAAVVQDVANVTGGTKLAPAARSGGT